MANDTPKTTFVTGKCRINYAAIFSPEVNDLNGYEEYSAQLIFPKDDKKTADKFMAAVDEATAAQWGNKPPRDLHVTLHDADEYYRDKDREPPEHLVGCYFVRANSKYKPVIVDRRRQMLTDPTALQNGDYVHAELTAKAYDQKGNRGVKFYLNKLQFVETGEALQGSGQSVEDAFADLGDDENDDWAA